MVCSDIHTTLQTILARYEREQVCCVMDEKIKTSTVLEPTFSLIRTLLLLVQESEKSLETVQKVWDFFFAQGLTRKGLVIAVGGGALTDLVGFAAGTYKRGVDCLYIPTTLLSMVDASTGGKTGFNYHGLKNSIGLFAPPVETLVSLDWLKTLPADQFLSGFAEMLKMGLIEKTPLWDELLRYDLEMMPLEELKPLVARCIEAKDHIVAADPHEVGLRKILNFGHTFGHALEEISLSANETSGLLHGYAVLYGMIAELYLSVTKLGCPKEPLQQLTQLMLHSFGRPTCKCSDRAQLIALMQQDKKNERTAQINCTLIRTIGNPVINQTITPQEAEEALDYLFSL